MYKRVGQCSQCGVCCKERNPFKANSLGEPCERLEYRDGKYWCLDYGIPGTVWDRACRNYPETQKELDKYTPAAEACSYEFLKFTPAAEAR